MNAVQWVSLFTFLIGWWIGLFHLLGIRTFWKYYFSLRTRVMVRPPPWIFTVVNNIAYPVAAVAGHQYINWATANRPLYDAGLALYLATFVLEKLWNPMFFGMRWLWGAMLIMTALLLTSISTLIVWWIDTANNGVSNYVAAGLFILYTLWVLFRFLFNLDVAWNNSHVYLTYREDLGSPGIKGRTTTHLRGQTTKMDVYSTTSAANRYPTLYTQTWS